MTMKTDDPATRFQGRLDHEDARLEDERMRPAREFQAKVADVVAAATDEIARVNGALAEATEKLPRLRAIFNSPAILNIRGYPLSEEIQRMRERLRTTGEATSAPTARLRQLLAFVETIQPGELEWPHQRKQAEEYVRGTWKECQTQAVSIVGPIRSAERLLARLADRLPAEDDGPAPAA